MLRVHRGEALECTSLRIARGQIIGRNRAQVSIMIWRNDEGVKKSFEINLTIPWGNIYKVASYKTQKGVERAYRRIVRQFESGVAKIEIGGSFRILCSANSQEEGEK